jgi:hypothetical protein
VAAIGDILNPQAVVSAIESAGHWCRPLLPERVWPYRRLPLVATYRDVDHEALGAWWTVAALAPGRTPRSVRRSLSRGDSIALPELGAVALRFPHDCDLPQMAALSDPARVANRIGPLLTRKSPVQSIVVRPQSYKPMRRLVVSYSVTTDGGETTEWIGKCSGAAADRRAWTVHQAWSDARAAAFPTGFDVAQPIGRAEDWCTMLWSRAPGVSLLDLLLRGEAAQAAGKVGDALAEIQRSGVEWQGDHRASDELAIVTRWRDALRLGRPEVAHLVERAASGLESKTVSTTELVPCHRDFYDKQWLLDGARPTLVDLDTACLAEPELDVGNFSAHLTLRGLQHQGLDIDESRRAFFEGYQQRAGRMAADRLAFYEACALVRLACVYGLRGRGRRLVAGLADSALSVLGAPTVERRFIHAI